MKTIPITQGKHVIVDDSDYDNLVKYNWCLTESGYAVRRENGKTIYMHQQILGARMRLSRTYPVNKLDNRRCNLTVAA